MMYIILKNVAHKNPLNFTFFYRASFY